MKRLLLGVAAFAGLLAVTGSTAQAQWGHDSYHYGAGSYGMPKGYGFGHTNPYSYGWQSGCGSWGYSPRIWHDTTHYDYHPTTIVPHGNHFHIQPGHYHLHRSGHWH